MADSKVDSQEVGKLIGITNGYNPGSKMIIKANGQEANELVMQILQVRAFELLGITDEQLRDAVRKAEAEGKVKVEVLSLQRIPKVEKEEEELPPPPSQLKRQTSESV
jgi:hypothetical protein